jgi:hypoxanthine phosphoribosyltransferase
VDDETGSGDTMEFSKIILRKSEPEEIKTATLFRHHLNYRPDFSAVTGFRGATITPWDMASPYYDQFLTEFSKITF